jgi:hypothetical protein
MAEARYGDPGTRPFTRLLLAATNDVRMAGLRPDGSLRQSEGWNRSQD